MPTYAKTQHHQVKSEDTKYAILKSAEKLFAEQGFNKTTVREIAGDSHVNVAMVYYYFQNKDGLHQEILEESLQALHLLLRDCVSQEKDPEKNIYCIIQVYINFFYQNKNLHRIILREIVSRSKHIEMMVKKYVSKNFNLIRGIIQEGVDKGLFRKQDTTLATFSLVGMILNYFTSEQVISKLISVDKGEITQYLPDHIFNLFMNGVKKETS